MMIIILSLFIGFLVGEEVKGRIVMVTCSPHISHFNVIFPIAKEFSDRIARSYPNDVVYFGGSEKLKEKIENETTMKFYHLYPGIEEHWEQHIVDNREEIWKDNKNVWPGIFKTIDRVNHVVVSIFPEYMKTLERLDDFEKEVGRKPDLVLVDPLAAGGKAYAKKRNIPHVTLSPSLQSPHPYAFGFPAYFGTSSIHDMTFFRSLYENVVWLVLFGIKSFKLLVDPRGMYKAFIDKSSNPQIIATVIGFDYPTYDTLSYYLKYVGFIPYIRLKPELSEDLESFLDENPRTVFVSSGTSVIWPDEVVEGIYRTLEKLDISVVASVNQKARKFFDPKKRYFEESRYKNRIRFENWVNQYLLLKHPSVRLFVSHGGAGGISEAIDTETPLFVVPQTADQFANSVRCFERGIGERIASVDEFRGDPSSFEVKLRNLFFDGNETGKGNQFYVENLKKLNKISKLHGGVKAAADFLEEVLVYGGYEHLKTFENPHRFKILVIKLIFFVLLLFGCFKLGVCCSQRKNKKKTD